MLGDRYTLEYSPQFYDELAEAIRYVTFRLRNPDAARRLKDDVETAILDRRTAPLSFAPYHFVRTVALEYPQFLTPEMSRMPDFIGRDDFSEVK